MVLPTEEHVPASAPPTPVAGAVQSYAIVLQGREGRLDGVLTILDGLSVAMEVAAELRERGTAVTVMGWTPPS
ncbi:MAG: hypothetical protein NVSMB12_19420 [Acidimicrobiales bacterium]